ncbi:aspartyl protease family protein [Ulvibacter antarcticus]|uniref:aspartyl protease family protein n=1 Tax=Ulvibacter antarcticus TaxID=442714 RepID=UPI00147413A7|nr:aspartyl protease family protein [Ulvibacter antarcticus]
MKIKKNTIVFTVFVGLCLCCNALIFAQSGFNFEKGVKKDKIVFELINNLVIVPVELNGEKLSFLLDTGVNATILFGVTQADSIRVNDIKPVKLRGLGGGEGVEAYVSRNNIITLGQATDRSHSIYIIFDKTLNFSPRMGVPIHGILGYDFFKKFIVKVDYIGKKITFYDPSADRPRIGRAFQSFDLNFRKNKPYVDFDVSLAQKQKTATLLVDSGSSDALWLFDEEHSIIEVPKNYFSDFLGLGLSGHIYGKRSKIEKMDIGRFQLSEVNVAFPNKAALEDVVLVEGRDGSLGGDVLKRFTVIFDYPSRKMYLRRNGNFNQPFNYNMSGLTIEHSGMTLVKDIDNSTSDFRNSDRMNESISKVTIQVSPVFKFFMAPRFVVADVRENSPAGRAGILEGDEILSINGKPAFRFELYQIISLFTSDEGKRISLQVDRAGNVFKVKFKLQKVI